MSTHPREHEELLAALAAGERGPAEPEAERRLRECADCARQWTALQDVQRRLENTRQAEEAALDELQREPAAPGEERVLATLTRLAAAEPHARPRRRAVAWLTAAVLLFAGAWLVLHFLGGERGSNPPIVLGHGLEIQRPRGPVASYAPFEWSDAIEADSYVLRIYDAKDTARSHPVLEHRDLEGSPWTPTAQELESLPARIEWELVALDAQGAVRREGSDSAEAWLSP
jgi:hypothetical protein